ncbi:MAG TPA: copper chaperone PCu(A)C [Paracoccus solventivorans]|uniref:Copper chaperone PCu(A)C n=1 Tax=Paracoccus solventivorans TaxID=53463 RepID=A0A832QXQ4_9RHOB|nr:copper chaperone PCu(A)C [Paracoccus solventivorans]HHW35354.1 copper chaperone PCu(A)C [Paracoccus solventivorans]
MNRTSFIAAALAAILPAAVLAQDITVTDAYARSTNPSVGAAFMSITNNGSSDCVLGAASAPQLTDRTELHTHVEENGVMSMVQVDSITIPAGTTHALERGGDHVMFMATKAPMAQGDEFELTLDFGSCGTVPVALRVDNDFAPAGGHDAHNSHGAAH